MLKEMIVAFSFLATFLAISPALAGDNVQRTSSISKMTPIPKKNSMLDMKFSETQRLIQEASDFVGKKFITNSWLTINQKINSPPEILSDALCDRMQSVAGKWSHVVQGVFVEGGIIPGQALVTAFVVLNARHQVLAVGGISVGTIGENDGNPLDATDPNKVDIFYKSRTDLQTALPQINGFARFYIKSFDNPSSPATNPPSTFIERQYDLGRCSAGKTGKHIDVETCLKQTRTLPVN
ncbi:hypothetical protein [Acidithiobacillus sulfurivorans]|jgi:hypothetical protein|uniref:Uncharacterized protein n=1 Tax=Acidithiobacillus sulfurivorans TaxID=1958756 RepID=A0ABS5ZY28_9PROT|nr:hypothetical protein [Acidithiobacillus sulfurivorans]MBU2760032.1 hypothetical protein [Acidithiobacillus sulfurivorans]